MNVAPFALCAGVSVGSLVYAASRPWRRLAGRLDPYTVAVRARLGAPRAELLALVDASEGGALASVLGPIVSAGARRLSALFGHRDEASLALALDRAGIRGVTPADYARQQLLFAVAGLVGGFLLGLSRGGRAAVVLALTSCFFGATWKRNELDKRTTRRTARMRAELVDICGILATFSRALPNLQSATAAVVAECHGEIAGELARVLGLIASGVSPEAAFRRMGDLTPEPSAARLYQRLAVALESGGDIVDALKAHATDLHDLFRDERKARATRRTAGMVIVNSTVMLISLIILMAAAIPSMVLRGL